MARDTADVIIVMARGTADVMARGTADSARFMSISNIAFIFYEFWIFLIIIFEHFKELNFYTFLIILFLMTILV